LAQAVEGSFGIGIALTVLARSGFAI